LLGQVGGRIDELGVLDVVVGKENHLQAAAHRRVVIDPVAGGGDELDDALGQEVTGGGFAGENEGACRHCGLRILEEPQIQRENVEHVEVLALVLVDALDQHVEKRFRIDADAGARRYQRRKPPLVGKLHLAPLLLEFGLVCKRFEQAQPGQIAQPAPTDARRDQLG